MIYSKEIQDELYGALKYLVDWYDRIDNAPDYETAVIVSGAKQALSHAEKEDTEWTKNIAQY